MSLLQLISRRKGVLISLLLGCLVGGGVYLSFSAVPALKGRAVDENQASLPAPAVGFLAPDFRLWEMHSQREVSLSSYKGKVVIINFWATWCGPCRVEMPSMEALYRDMKGSAFEILAVSNDLEGEAIVRPFVEALDLTFPILLDPNFQVNLLYNVRGLPMTFVIDKKGRISQIIPGARSWNHPEAKALINSLITAG